MTPDEAIAKLDAIEEGDPESAHGEADRVLLSVAPQEVGDAYERLQERVGDWWFA